MTPPRGRHRLFWWGGCSILAAVLVSPFFLAQIPPVLDYPNHLARAFILTFGSHNPWLSQMYEAHWRILPDLAVDLVLPPLLHILPINVAGRVFLGASLFLPLAGVLAYSRALFGRLTRWSLGSALVAYNVGFLLGFLNFLWGVGGALLVASIWIGCREKRPRTAVIAATCGAIVIFFCHIMGVVLLGVLVGAYELDRLVERRSAGKKVSARWLLGRAGAVLTVFMPTVVLFAFSPTAGMGGPTRWVLPAKALLAFAPLMNYNFNLDLITASVLLAFLALALAKGWVTMPRSSGIVLLLLAFAYLLAPFQARGDAFFDVRFAVMFGYVLFAGLAEKIFFRRGAAVLVALGFLTPFAIRMGLVARVWEEQNAQVAEFKAAVKPVPAGARVLIALVTLTDAPRYWLRAPLVRLVDGAWMTNIHVPALLLARRNAFSPFIFSNPAVVPLAVRSAYRGDAMVENFYGPPSYTKLGLSHQSARERRIYPFLVRWPSKFDYVLILGAGGLPDPRQLDDGELKLVRFTDAAALYRVRRSPVLLPSTKATSKALSRARD